MAKTSIHIQPVRGGSEEHNKREKTLDYVRAELSHLNEYFEVCTQSERLAAIKSLVKEKTGRTMQAKATPLREAVVVIKQDTTMNDLQNLAARIRERWGIETIQIAIHKDEGHVAAKEWKSNLHAHLVFDFTDHESGKSIKMSREDMSELQTLVAECLNMQRGVSSSRSHLSAVAYKVAAKGQELDKLSVAVAAKESTIETIRAVGAAVTDVVKGRRKKAMREVIREIVKAAGFKIKCELTAEAVGKSWRSEFDKAQKTANLTRKLDETVQWTENLQNALKTSENAKNRAQKALWEERNVRKDAEEERDAAQDEARQARNERDSAVEAVAILLHVSEPEAREKISELLHEKREKEIKRESRFHAPLDENLELIEPEDEEQEQERSRGFHK